MNRTTAAALIAAGIVGVVGGTVSAVVRGEDAPGGPTPLADAPSSSPSSPPSSPSSSPSRSASPSASPTSATPAVLYAGKGRIVDGKREITWTAPYSTPSKLVRSADGYLLSFSTSPQEPAFDLWSVAPDGTSRLVARTDGRWDLDESGRSVVGRDLQSGKIMVWSLDGTVEATWKVFPGLATAAWVGDQVMISPEPESRTTPLPRIFWDPRTRATRTSPEVGFSHLTSSPDGRLVGGQVNSEGIGTTEDDDRCLASERLGDTTGTAQWHTCDWRSNVDGVQYSPGSDKVIAIPAETDGFGPGVFGIFSATQGPKAGVTEVRATTPTLGAEWLDDEHLLLYGATDYDLDDQTVMTIRTCDLAGSCREVSRGRPGEKLVVATS